MPQQKKPNPTNADASGARVYRMDEPQPTQQAKTLYDEKVAQTPANQYNDENPQKWLEWTRGYLIGRRWEMENLRPNPRERPPSRMRK